MKKKKTIITLSALIAAAALGTSAFVYAHGNDGFAGFGFRAEGNAEVKEAMDNGDYQAWKNLVSQKADEFASEENFDNMKQVHDLMAEGNVEEAEALREELGMPGKGHGRRVGDRLEMKQYIESGDYEGWKAAMEEKLNERLGHLEELESNISEETFNGLVEAHNLAESGDYEAARQIRDDLGFPGGPGHRGMK